jgi:peptidyl-prolyl cis-trans isomerase A (cyclophilin A)
MQRKLVLLLAVVSSACSQKPSSISAIDAGPPIDTSDRDPMKGVFTLRDALLDLAVTSTIALVAKIETTEGVITARLYAKQAPKTVANFVGLAKGTRPWRDPRTNAWTKKPFYDGLTFHRVIPEFMIQGGDPLGSGLGGPGYKIEDEIDPDLAFDAPGLLAMANARAPNTNGSQFFITETPVPSLDGKHTIFGEVTDGIDVVKRIARVAATDTHPNEPVVIRRIVIERP